MLSVYLILFASVFGMTSAEKKEFLKVHSPGVRHDALPAGVAPNANYLRQATKPSFRRMPSDKYVNPWGQIYRIEGDSISKDAHVEVAWMSLWALKTSTLTWVRLVHSSQIGGGSWANNFKSKCNLVPDLRLDNDHYWSMKSRSLSCNMHFWPVTPSALLVPDSVVAFLIVSPMRVSPIDSAVHSNLIASVGADWKGEHGRCSTPKGYSVPMCVGIGTGPFQRIGNDWKLISYYAVKPGDYGEIPMPPDSAFSVPEK